MDACWHHHDYTSISTGIISQYVANVILQPQKREEVLERGRKLLRANVPVVQRWIDAHGGNFHMIPPRAGAWPLSATSWILIPASWLTRLREERSVLVVAGDWFGMDRYLRLGIGGETDELVAGLELVDEFLDEQKIS